MMLCPHSSHSQGSWRPILGLTCCDLWSADCIFAMVDNTFALPGLALVTLYSGTSQEFVFCACGAVLLALGCRASNS